MRTRLPRPSPDRFEGRQFTPPPASERPLIHRRAARVVIVDESQRLLLFEDSDLGLEPVLHWWICPGGGVDPGESDVEAAVRETFEETGLAVAADDLLGPVATRRVLHGYSDLVCDQQEVYYMLRVPAFDVVTDGHTDDERATVHDIRWWPVPELADSSEDVWPRALLDILALAERPHCWAEAPVDLGVSEESTVPCGADPEDLAAPPGRV